MNTDSMTQTRLRAWLAIVIWMVAGIGFCLAFFMRGGPREFGADSGRHVAAAAAIAFGFLTWWAALWKTRATGDEVVSDERDLHVMARAGQTTLVVVLVAIYAFTIGLWTVFEGAGSVPVGWMWFVAYGSVILATVTHALSVLILDGRTSGHG